MNERRTAPRMNVSLEAVWDGTTGKYQARICDISTSGCYMDTIGEAVTGAVINFRFQLPDGDWLLLQGQVTHYQRTVGMGLRFLSLSQEEEAKIRRLLNGERGTVGEIKSLSSASV